MSVAVLGKKQYLLLGKLLVQKRPELASEYLSSHASDLHPQETDFKKIDQQFVDFCMIKQINPGDYRGALYNRNKVDTRRVFISTIIRFYLPELYLLEHADIPYGFLAEVARVLGMSRDMVCKAVRVTVAREKVYDDYKAEVNDAVNQLKTYAGQKETAN